MKIQRKTRLISCTLLLAFALTLLFCTVYYFDNKYKTNDGSVLSLVDNWEYYPDQLFEPDDFHSGISSLNPNHIYIGQYGTFQTLDHPSPFGQATYRKVITLSERITEWLLELPEIYSASKVYINGELVREYGSLDAKHYAMETRNTLIPLSNGETEIIIQAANYSHYYSGLISPPLVGPSESILQRVMLQFIFYGLLCFFTLGITLASIVLWSQKSLNILYLSYGLMCLFFSIHISYPFMHWLPNGGGSFSYLIEDVSYFCMILCLTSLTSNLSDYLYEKKIHIGFFILAASMIPFCILSTTLIFPIWPAFLPIYSVIVTCFKIIIATYLITISVLAIVRKKGSLWLLLGNVMFGVGIMSDYYFGNRFEPIRFGYLNEYTGFLVVLIFALLIMKHNRSLALANEHLTLHLQEEVERKTKYLSHLLQERKQFLSHTAHDLKAPISVIQTYLDFIKDSDLKIDENMFHYLSVIEGKATQLQKDIQNLQIFNAEDRLQDPPIRLDFNAFLSYLYEETKPYCEANGIYYHLDMPSHTAYVYSQKNRLFRALENIVLNATEHTSFEGKISLILLYSDTHLILQIKDNGTGIAPESLPHIFEYRYSSQKNSAEQRGIGLYFAKVTIEEYGGSISVDSEQNSYTTFTILLPLLT